MLVTSERGILEKKEEKKQEGKKKRGGICLKFRTRLGTLIEIQ